MVRLRGTEVTYSISTYDRCLTIAFQADVENLLLKFEKLYSLRFSDFASVWRDWVKIRITLDEYLKLQDLISRLRQEQQLEPLFCYAKLLTNNAFEYVFQKKPLAPETRYMKNFSDYIDDTFQVGSSLNSTLDLKGKLNEDNFLEKFTKTTTNYKDALSKFSVQNPGLGIFQSTILEELQSTLDFLEKSTEPLESLPKDNSIYAKRTKIKDKAMSVRGASNSNAGLKEESDESFYEDI